MPTETGRQLTEYAGVQVGDALRTVAILYENDCEVVFLRDDLKEQYEPEQYNQVATSYRTKLTHDTHSDDGHPVGDKHSTIHYHENAFVFQFPHENCHSILLSVEPDVGSRLESFIEGCRKRL